MSISSRSPSASTTHSGSSSLYLWPSRHVAMMLSSGSVLITLLSMVLAGFASTGTPSSAEIAADLAPLLSQHAEVVIPRGPQERASLISRSSWPRISPGYLAVVEVYNEKDIQQVVRYANQKKLPFLAVSTGSGWTTATNKLHNGIQISMRKMQSLRISPHGTTATIGGGTIQNLTVKTLAEDGKRAVTGLCECVSVIGPLLGGGHSLQQGKYGFAADNLVSARMILANGTAITVSHDQNSDLFWAIRGAGHNFGIVASFETKIHDIPSGEAGLWTLTVLNFDQFNLETFFHTWNDLEEQHPNTNGLVVLGGLFTPDANGTAIISMSIAHEGANLIADTFISRFRSVGTLTFSQETGIAWAIVHDKMGLGEAPICVRNKNFFTTPASFSRWNVTNMRESFHIFADFIKIPQFTESFWLLESYGRGEAALYHDDAIAAEERDYHLMAGLTLQWTGDDPNDRKTAEDFALKAKHTIQQGWAEDHTYINYAVGYETLNEIYGRNKEHLDRLQGLKAKWDPENRFGFYAPLVSV